MEQDGSNPIRINCVILNFNDEETVARLVHMIHDYDYLEKIVLVDNHSTDDSWEQLQVLKDEKVELIRTEKNGGYGYGNNTGMALWESFSPWNQCADGSSIIFLIIPDPTSRIKRLCM